MFIGPEPNHSNILSFLKEEGFSAAHAKILGTHLNLPRRLKKNNADDANGLLFRLARPSFHVCTLISVPCLIVLSYLHNLEAIVNTIQLLHVPYNDMHINLVCTITSSTMHS